MNHHWLVPFMKMNHRWLVPFMNPIYIVCENYSKVETIIY